MTKYEEIVEMERKLNKMDMNISEFLENNEMKFGGIDELEADYTTPVWVEYKTLCKERKKVSEKLAKLRGRGYN